MAKFIISILLLISMTFIITALFTFDQNTPETEFGDLATDKEALKEFNLVPITSDTVKADDTILSIEEEPSSNTSSLPSGSISIQENPYKELLNRNNDYVGWIVLNGTNISYPLVKGQDNDYYLKRNFDQAYDEKGTIYMDYRNFGLGFDRHTILYGHNMKDGSMFGDLKLYKDETFAKENRYIEIQDLYEIRTYEIVASYYAKANSDFIQTRFTDDHYQSYINDILDRSQIDYGLIPRTDDLLLTLVTCTYEVDDGRYFVHAIDITGSK